MADSTGKITVGWNGYFTQYDQLNPGVLMGRSPDVNVGPPQWITLGAGIALVGTVLSATGSGGDVSGPASSTDSVLAAWDGTTGALLKDSTVLAAWFDQSVTSGSSPTFAGMTTTALSVNGHVVTVSGAVTLDNWFDQSVKAAASPTFNGLTLTSLSVNTYAVTVNGATTLNDWFDQSVKVAASPTFAAVRATGNVRADGAFTSGTTVGVTQTALSVALHAGPDNFMNFDILGGILCNVSFTPT
jgi:hypothetical protein